MLDVISNGHGTDILLALLALMALALVAMAVLLSGIWHDQLEGRKERKELRDVITGVRADHRFFLTASSLGPLYEKINALSTDVAEVRAEQRATTEQLRIINRHLMNLQ